MKLRSFLVAVLLAAPGWVFSQQFSPASFVNPFIGTGGHGHTYPGAIAPFGMVQLSPDTRLTGWDGCSGYHFSDSVVYGFSHTHLSGTGVSDYCDVLLMPTVGKAVFSNAEYSSSFRKSSEKAEPGYYTVFLDKPQVKAELTALPRVGVHRYTFPATKNANILLDLEHRDEVTDSWIEVVSNTEVRGFRRSKAWANNQVIYFVIRFSKPFDAATFDPKSKAIGKAGKYLKCNFGFQTKKGEQVVAKVGISAVDMDGAKANLDAEMKGFSFDSVRKQTFASWNRELSKIEVSGGTKDQQTIFYSALYHCMSVPNLFMDVDGRYLGTDHKIHKAEGFTPYTIFSLWDTYRAYHPLMTIIETRRTKDFINTFLSHYKNGGLLPVWELAGNETFCMIGYHSVPVIADAFIKGIKGFDEKLALEAMRNSAMQDHYGLSWYRQLGCLPGDKEWEGVSKTLEYAYDDWCIAQMAKKMGNTAVYNEYIARAQFYQNLFDPETGFMRPRLNGGFKTPFNPTEVDFNFTEANSWQYSFYVPQDIAGLVRMHGGAAKFSKKLDELFSTEQDLSGRHQSDITGLIGQYAHGNEPSHHMAYLYNFVGEPWKTQQRVRQIMDEMYTTKPDGLIGNEDCGQMSAWIVMSALGFYPVTPGTTDYIIGTPWFSKATINLEDGKKFTITAPRVDSKNFYIASATLNGKAYTKSYIDHSDIMKGGNLSFTMSTTPNRQWGVGKGNEPVTAIESYSRTIIPNIKAKAKTFVDSTTITLHSTEKDAKIYYTLNGSDPRTNGMLYGHPITLARNTQVKLVAVVPGKDTSFVVEGNFYKVRNDRKITIAAKYSDQYTAGGPSGLVDGVRGESDFRLGGWQGYQGQDFVAVVDHLSEQQISKLAAGLLQDTRSWIFMPRDVEFYVSNDNVNFTQVAKVVNTIPENQETALKDFAASVNVKARYVKVVAHSYGMLPQWHIGAGSPAYIFIDEIVIE